MTDSLKRIAVLVSAGKHPVSGQPRHCRNDSLALQMGLNLANDILVLHAGESENPALQDYLALGAPQINVIPTTDNIVNNLATQLTNTDLILSGTRAENGDDSGLLPYLLATKLNLALVADVVEIKAYENKIEILQFLPKGRRRRVTVCLPALVVVHPSAAVTLNFIHARQNLGSISTLSASNFDAKHSQSDLKQWHTCPARKPIKLAASRTLTGHERLMAAISSKAKGGAVVNEGNNVEKAQVILDYLREHQLIDF
ncbi:MAG: electron transfer flavoprotein subunit beta/FixA family protein [Bdellovibrio sp.]|nr:electron transfer flavoprotein subunit beta/FixA family protein [Methylotenera sp.]